MKENFMKCPRCSSEMEKGILNGGASWVKADGIATTLIEVGSSFGNIVIYAWKCSSCGKVELSAE